MNASSLNCVDTICSVFYSLVPSLPVSAPPEITKSKVQHKSSLVSSCHGVVQYHSPCLFPSDWYPWLGSHFWLAGPLCVMYAVALEVTQ